MRKAFLQLHIAVFLAGFTGVLGKLITLNEALLVWYRMMIAVAALWVLYLLKRKLVNISNKGKLQIVGVGALVALHWVTFYGSIKYANVSVALVCFSAIGFFTAILEPLIVRKPFNKIELLLGMLAIAGIAFIFHFDPEYKTGIIIGMVSSLLGALFPICNRVLVQQYHAETVTLYQLTGGFLFLSLVVPFYPSDRYIPTWSDVGWLMVLALFCTVLSFNLVMNVLKKISAFTVNLSYNLEPLYGIALAFLLFNEHKQLAGTFYVGLSLIVLSVVLQTFLVYREHSTRRP